MTVMLRVTDQPATAVAGIGNTVHIPDRTAVPVLVLDADDTVRRSRDREPPRHVDGPSDVEVYPDAAARIAAHRTRGGRVIIVSNQGGIGAGHIDTRLVAETMLETVRQLSRHPDMPNAHPELPGLDSAVDVVVWCPHDPGTEPGHTRQRCFCRKPAPGMIMYGIDELVRLHGQTETYPLERMLMVGDQADDARAAAAAGIDYLDAAHWRAGRTDAMIKALWRP